MNGTPGKKILIIDDDGGILFVMRRALELKNYSVQADSTFNGIPAIERYSPNLIFLDISLGAVDGVAVSNELKQNTTTSAIPIVILTGYSDVLGLAAKAHANDFLTKPFGLIGLWHMAAKYTGA